MRLSLRFYFGVSTVGDGDHLPESPTLNILALGEETAVALGLKLRNEKLILLLCAIAIASAAISLTGNIGFIGLMSPHIARKLVGKRHERYSWIARCWGAAGRNGCSSPAKPVWSE